MSEPAAPILVVRNGRAEGVVRYAHAGKQPFSSSEIGLECAELRGRHAEPLTSARVRGAVPPGAEGELRVKFRVHPTSRAGVYRARLKIGERAIPVDVAIPERRSVRVAPSQLTIDSSAADAEHLVIVDNVGNVPVTIHHPAACKLEPTDRNCTVVRAALAGAAKQPFLDALIGAAAASTAADPILAARFTDAPVELEPGRRAMLRLRLRLPQRLAERQYTAVLSVAGAPLTIALQRTPNGDGPEAAA